jgi:hypothetical protein
MGEVKRRRRQLAREEVVILEFHLREPVLLHKRPGCFQHLVIDVGSDDHSAGFDPLCKHPQPTHRAATNVERAVNSTGVNLLKERLASGLPDARLQPEPL